MIPLRHASMILLIWLNVFGQDPEVRFEVASVKPSDPAAQGSTFSFNRNTGLRVTNGTLKALIEMAYDVRSFQISGGPGWLDSDRYDLLAKNTTDDPPGAEAPSPNDRLRLSRLRLQALLADRFQLKIHRATQDRSAYALTVAKSGTKLQDRPADDANMGLFTDCGRMDATRATLATVVLALARDLDRPVLDHTGLTGHYDFKLAWTPEIGPCSAKAGGTNRPPDRPSLFTALQEELGLRLDTIKAPVEIIVVDQAVKPVAN